MPVVERERAEETMREYTAERMRERERQSRFHERKKRQRHHVRAQGRGPAIGPRRSPPEDEELFAQVTGDLLERLGYRRLLSRLGVAMRILIVNKYARLSPVAPSAACS